MCVKLTWCELKNIKEISVQRNLKKLFKLSIALKALNSFLNNWIEKNCAIKKRTIEKSKEKLHCRRKNNRENENNI